MNEEARIKLAEITKKEIPALTEHDILFMRARRSYLTQSEKEYYKEVLEVKETKKKTEK